MSDSIETGVAAVYVAAPFLLIAALVSLVFGTTYWYALEATTMFLSVTALGVLFVLAVLYLGYYLVALTHRICTGKTPGWWYNA